MGKIVLTILITVAFVVAVLAVAFGGGDTDWVDGALRRVWKRASE